ncbi:MAG: hypothetical protein Kow00121_23970 [Elainellaceae cyanobacterium]
MELIYRGARHSYNPEVINVEDTPVVGQYRGAALRLHKATRLSLMPRVLHLIYRGVSFDEKNDTSIAYS